MKRATSRGYKRYLERGSSHSIPASTLYRFKKAQRLQVNVENVARATSSGESGELLSTGVRHAGDCNAADLHVVESNEEKMSQEGIRDEACSRDIRQHDYELLPTEDDVNRMFNDLHCEKKAVNEYRREDWLREDDDNCMSCVDSEDDDEDIEESSTGYSLLQHSTTLKDAIDREALMERIPSSANENVGGILLMILKFIIVHALSLTAATDLFNMVNAMFAEKFLPNSRYLIDKLLYPKDNVTLYASCKKCGTSMGRFERKDGCVTCTVCEAVVDLGDQGFKDFFVMMNVGLPVSKLITANGEYYENVVNHRIHETGNIRDIYDGVRYREFVRDLQESDAHSYATLTFNTDGAPIFESSNNSIWPVFVMVNEIPLRVRTTELILAGLWFGKDKPDMNVFLQPFVNNLNELSNKGVPCIVNGMELQLKIFALICCVDAVARAPVQGFTQFNGAYGCGHCLHPGEWVLNDADNVRSGTVRYPLLDYVPEYRNVEQTVGYMRQAVATNRPVCGVKNASVLINLKSYDVIDGCVVDSLHCCSGIAKQFATLWFGNDKNRGLLPRGTVKAIDKVMSEIKAPHQVGRLTRALSDRAFWKAREWENWTIFYSMVLLAEILPRDLLDHWALFVEAFYILLKSEITFLEVSTANKLLLEFVGKTEILYGKKAMSFNVHSLIHVAPSVSHWGPLWCHNAYAFESGNGDLLKVIHAAKGIHQQICRQIMLKYCFADLKEHVYSASSFAIRHYCDVTGTKFVKRDCKVNDIRYVGSINRINDTYLERLGLGDHTVAYKKIIKDSCLYTSSTRQNRRSSNSFALLNNNSYVQIIYFIVDVSTGKQYTIVRKIVTTRAINDKCGMLQRINEISDRKSAVPTTAISKVCVHIQINGIGFLCAVPNLHHY